MGFYHGATRLTSLSSKGGTGVAPGKGDEREMRVPRRTFLAAAMFASAVILFAPGCASQPPPDTVYVADGPPAMQIEVVAVSPGPDFVWVPGWWNYDRTYVWVAGSWQRPP